MPALMWFGRRRFEVGIVSMWHVRGIAIVAHQLATALESGDVRTHVLARWEADRFRNEPPVHHPRVTDGGQDPSPEDVLRWAADRRLDAVLFCEVHPADWKRVDALRAAGRRVFALENLDILRHDAIPLYGALDGMVHSSFTTARAFRALHPHVPAITVPWGIPSPRRLPRRPPHRRRRFLHVSGWGGLGNRKNTDGILRAWLDAPPRDTDLVLYSQAPLDRLGAAVADAARRHPGIELHEDTVPSLDEAFAGADLVLCPSRREGIGLPQLEALAGGVPVLVSDGSMMSEWVVAGEHAIVCDGRAERDGMYLPLVHVDPETLSRAMADAATPGRLDAMRASVVRDREVWRWTWQPAVLRRELARMLREPGYAPDPAWSYVPDWRRAFETRRALSPPRA